jgi:hypothetical protein
VDKSTNKREIKQINSELFRFISVKMHISAGATMYFCFKVWGDAVLILDDRRRVSKDLP